MEHPQSDEYIGAEKYIMEIYDKQMSMAANLNRNSSEVGEKPISWAKFTAREYHSKMEQLEKELFMLRLQLTYYRNCHRLDDTQKRNLDHEIQNGVCKNEIREQQVKIWKAAKVLRAYEIKVLMQQKAINRQNSGNTLFDDKNADSIDWKIQNHHQLFQFSLNELTAQVQRLKYELNAREADLSAKDQIISNLHAKLTSMTTLNNYLDKKFEANEKTVADLSNKNKKWNKVYSKMADEIVNLLEYLSNNQAKHNLALSQVQATEKALADLEIKSANQLKLIDDLWSQIASIKHENVDHLIRICDKINVRQQNYSRVIEGAKHLDEMIWHYFSVNDLVGQISRKWKSYFGARNNKANRRDELKICGADELVCENESSSTLNQTKIVNPFVYKNALVPSLNQYEWLHKHRRPISLRELFVPILYCYKYYGF